MLKLKQATYDDAKTLFQWTNDPLVRANSFNSNDILWEEHCEWLCNVLQNEHKRLYILYDERGDLGQIRIDIDGKVATISYSIASQFRGQGLGLAIISLVEKRIAELKCIDEIRAYVKFENSISCRIFNKLGYKQIKEEKAFCFIKSI